MTPAEPATAQLRRDRCRRAVGLRSQEAVTSGETGAPADQDATVGH
jgi:hypothetical protein